MTGVSLRKIGGDIPDVMEAPGNGARPLSINRVADFEGDKYVVHNAVIYKLSASGTWDADYTLGASAGNTQEHAAGLYTILAGDESFLCHIWKRGTTTLGMVRKSSSIDGGGAWGSETTYTTQQSWTQGNGTSVMDALQIDNLVYFRYSDENGDQKSPLFLANLETEGFSELQLEAIPPETNVNTNGIDAFGSFSPFNSKLYYTITTTETNSLKENYLYEVEGSVVRKLHLINRIQQSGDITNGLEGNNNTRFSHRDGLFSKGSGLYAIVWATGLQGINGASVDTDDQPDDGWGMYKYIPSGNTVVFDSDVSDTVLPASLRRNVTDSNPVGALWSGRWSTVNQVDASGDERVYLYFENDGEDGTPRSLYEFIDDTQELDLIDIGANAAFSLPTYQRGGGNYESKPISAFIKDVREGTNAGTIDIDVRIKGSGQEVIMGVLFNTEKDTPVDLMNLSATNSGSLIQNNTAVSGLIAGSGDLFTITWLAENQGVSYAVKTLMNPIITLV
jgi:hypothetical protein